MKYLHAISLLQALDVFSDSLNYASCVTSSDERPLFDENAEGLYVVVRRVECGGMYLDQNLTRPRFWNRTGANRKRDAFGGEQESFLDLKRGHGERLGDMEMSYRFEMIRLVIG